MVRPGRFELPTLRFVAARSIQLSYGRFNFYQRSVDVCLKREFYTDSMLMTMDFL